MKKRDEVQKKAPPSENQEGLEIVKKVELPEDASEKEKLEDLGSSILVKQAQKAYDQRHTLKG